MWQTASQSRAFALCLVLVLTGAAAGRAGVDQWSSQGPYEDDVLSLAIDPRTPSTLYAGTVRRGVFKSIDGGMTWRPTMGSFPPERVQTLLIDGAAPSNVYAGTELDGVYRSTDGGETWTRANDGLTDLEVTALVGEAAVIYAATGFAGVFKSTNGGQSWSAVNEGLTDLHVAALALDPQTPATLYAATLSGLFKSIDADEGWSFLTAIPARVLVIDPRTPTVLYAGNDASYTGEDGLWRSADGGAVWTPLGGSLPAPGGVKALAIAPSTPAVLYLGLAGGLWRSADGARSWASTGLPYGVEALAIDARSPSTVYAGGHGSGVWKSVDGGASWSARSEGLGRAGIYGLAADPAASVVHATSAGGNLYRSLNRGRSWAPSIASPRGIGHVTAAPSTPSIVYGTSASDEVWASADGGVTWVAVGTSPGSVTDLAVDPATPSTLYAATLQRGVFKSVDGAASWMPVNDGFGVPLNLAFSILVIDPLTPTTLYAGTNGGLFVSRDGGGSWTRLDLPTRRPPPVSVVTIDPRTPSTLYAYTFLSGRSVLWKSADGGASWSRTGLERGVRDLVIDPAVPSVLYAGTSKRVFRSTDGGATWSPFNEGLAFGGGLHDLAIAGAYPSTVFAATDGGVFDVRVVTGLPVLVLRDGRFRVEIAWRDFTNATGQGKVAVAGDDSGLFYFFTEDNWELLVKVLDGCRVNGHFWVFGAATTDVEYTLTVTDTAAGTVKTYRNPLGVASPAITDTRAFATCAVN